MRKPLAIEMYAGLGGWTEGLLAEGYDCIGFDIERHVYGDQRYPAQLVLQDVLTIHGSQFRDASLIVASPPCQEFSYMAMPWSRAKAIAAEYRSGARDTKKLTALFDACFRIQQEACAAAGHHIPMVVENVRGAQPWVGRSNWNYGSFHLWGNVPALMPMTKRATKVPMPAGGDSLVVGFQQSAKLQMGGVKVPGMNWSDRSRPAQAFNDTAIRNMREDIKNSGGSWFAVARNTTSGKGQNPDGRLPNNGRDVIADEIKGRDGGWFNDKKRKGEGSTGRLIQSNSKSSARKAASAMIAKIPAPLARYIARVYRQNVDEISRCGEAQMTRRKGAQ